MLMKKKLLIIAAAGFLTQLSFCASDSDKTWLGATNQKPLYLKNNTNYDVTVTYKLKDANEKLEELRKYVKKGAIQRLTDNVREMWGDITIEWHSMLQSAGLLNIGTGEKVAKTLYKDTTINLHKEQIFPSREVNAYLLTLSTGWGGGSNIKIDPYDP